MAIGVIFQAQGTTQAQYDQVRQQVLPDNQPAPGMIAHAAGPSENGFCVIEVWESQEAAQAFFEAKLGQALHAAKINVQPTFFEVINSIRR